MTPIYKVVPDYVSRLGCGILRSQKPVENVKLIDERLEENCSAAAESIFESVSPTLDVEA